MDTAASKGMHYSGKLHQQDGTVPVYLKITISYLL